MKPNFYQINGLKYWRLPDGKLHNENGPSLIYNDGKKYWYLNGKELSEQEWKIKTRKLKLKKLKI